VHVFFLAFLLAGSLVLFAAMPVALVAHAGNRRS
jgi:hypothetical protein